MTAAALPQSPPAPGRWASLALTLGMHVLLALFLIYGIRWQIQKPAAVEVELVNSLPAPTPVAPPVVEPAPAEPLKPEPPKPEPPRVAEPKPMPKALPPTPKPDIAVKAKPEPKPAQPKKPEPKKAEPRKPEPKPVESAPPRVDPMQEMLRKEDQRLAEAKRNRALESELAQLKEAKVSAQRQSDTDAWLAKLRGKIRGNLVLPPNVRGNPAAVFAVTLLPSGDVLNARLTRSSGIAALDTAIERAIRKSSPLPKPEKAEVFERDLSLEFRPLEE